ncbi:MAG: TonB family protein [Hymenobacter sp.]|nr:MAG: TonB family protein [Hymenobacter sp.]
MRISAGLWLLGALCSGAAQAQSTYCPIWPMPELPGGGGSPAIVAAIQRRVTYPPQALRANATGRVFVSFVITPDGRVQEVFVVKAFRRDCGLAVVNAVQRLPRFTPRLRKYGNVRYVAPITFSIEGRKPIGPPSRQEYAQAHSKVFRHLNPKP